MHCLLVIGAANVNRAVLARSPLHLASVQHPQGGIHWLVLPKLQSLLLSSGKTIILCFCLSMKLSLYVSNYKFLLRMLVTE